MEYRVIVKCHQVCKKWKNFDLSMKQAEGPFIAIATEKNLLSENVTYENPVNIFNLDETGCPRTPDLPIS